VRFFLLFIFFNFRFLIFLGAITTQAYSQGPKKNFALNFSIFSQTQSLYKGATFWPGPSAMAGPSLILWQKLSILGPRIMWQETFSPSWKGKLGLSYVNDSRPLLPFTSPNRDKAIDRPAILEAMISCSYAVLSPETQKELLSFELEVSHDTLGKSGLFSKFSISTPFYWFRLLALGSALSWATDKTHEYLYDNLKEKGEGFGFIEAFARIFIPFVPWKGNLILSAQQYWILQQNHQRALSLRGESQNPFSASLILNFSLL